MLLKSEKLKQIQKTLDDFKIECIKYIGYKMNKDEKIEMESEYKNMYITKENIVYPDINVNISFNESSIDTIVAICDYIHLLPLKNLDINSIAYDEGFDEKSFGEDDINNNPYSLGTEDFNDWVDGFKNGLTN